MGLISEALDPAQVGYNAADPVLKSLEKECQHITPKKNGDNVAFYKMRGMDRKVTSIAMDHSGKPFKFRGYMISHGESNTLSRYLRKNTNPSVYYVYRPCEPAIKSLENMRKNDYKMPKHIHTVFLMPELKDGIDSIGAYITAKSGNWWMGTVLSSLDVRRLGIRYSTPTTVQVVISLLAAVRWMLLNPDMGIIAPEDLPYNKILSWCAPFLGKLISKRVSI
jgi:homospermidine synthase